MFFSNFLKKFRNVFAMKLTLKNFRIFFAMNSRLNINDKDIDRNTGFHVACFGGNLNIVQFFLEQGFDMNSSNDNGGTGFHAGLFWWKFKCCSISSSTRI